MNLLKTSATECTLGCSVVFCFSSHSSFCKENIFDKKKSKSYDMYIYVRQNTHGTLLRDLLRDSFKSASDWTGLIGIVQDSNRLGEIFFDRIFLQIEQCCGYTVDSRAVLMSILHKKPYFREHSLANY